jgi:hypothetical protein
MRLSRGQIVGALIVLLVIIAVAAARLWLL